MNYWVTKAKPKHYYKDEFYKKGAVDKSWWTSRVPSGIEKGDILFFWKSSPDRELIILGEFVKSEKKRRKDGNINCKVKYNSDLFKNPIKIDELRKHFGKNPPAFLKSGPSGTFYKLTDKEGERILNIIKNRNPELQKFKLGNVVRNKSYEIEDLDLFNYSAKEGRLKIVKHISYERDRKVIQNKKNKVLHEKGKLECEACGFDFDKFYGEKISSRYCEVHHLIPFSKSSNQKTTKPKDLAILCSNCHRMIHRKVPLITIKELKRNIKLNK